MLMGVRRHHRLFITNAGQGSRRCWGGRIHTDLPDQQNAFDRGQKMLEISVGAPISKEKKAAGWPST